MLGSGYFNCKLEWYLKLANFSQHFFNFLIVGEGSAYSLNLSVLIQEVCFYSPRMLLLILMHMREHISVRLCVAAVSTGSSLP